MSHTGSTSAGTSENQTDPHNFEDQIAHWSQQYGKTEDDLWDAIDPLFGVIQQVDQGQFLPNQIFKHGDRYFDLADGAKELTQDQAEEKAGLTPGGNQVEKPESVQLLEQLYALPPSSQRGSRGDDTAGTSHVEANGLVFNPTEIVRVTSAGYVIPHGDHFHVISKSSLNDLEIAAAEAVLADRAAGLNVDYPTDPNPDANIYEVQLALQAGQNQIEDQANTAKEDTDSQDQNIQTGQTLASSSATLSAEESQAKSKEESSSQDSQALPQTGSSSLLLASLTSLMAGAWSLVRRKNK